MTGYSKLDTPYVDSSGRAQQVAMRCPWCRHVVVLEAVAGQKDVRAQQRVEVTDRGPIEVVWAFGLRRCPRLDCHGAIFVIHHEGEVTQSFPPEVIDIDLSDLPDDIVDSLTEALTCHSVRCYKAAAIMIRRTLEEVCADQGVTKGTLVEKLTALSQQVIIPADLVDGLHDLRLLGNDAAHLEARAYKDIGRQEVELGVEVVKLLLVSLYQTRGIVERLRAMRRQD
jgi:hypothetical protein